MESPTPYQNNESALMQRIKEDPSLSLKKKKEALLELKEGYKRGLKFFQDSNNTTGITMFSELDEKVNILIQDIESQTLTIKTDTRKKLRPSTPKVDKSMRSADIPPPVAQPRTREAPPVERPTPVPAPVVAPASVAPASAPPASQPPAPKEISVPGEKGGEIKKEVTTFKGGVKAFLDMFK